MRIPISLQAITAGTRSTFLRAAAIRPSPSRTLVSTASRACLLARWTRASPVSRTLNLVPLVRCFAHSTPSFFAFGAGTLSESEPAAAFETPQTNLNNNVLYVGNIPYEATWNDVCQFFCQFAKVERVHMSKFPDGRPVGYGFVYLTNPAQVDYVIEKANGVELLGRSLTVCRSVVKAAKPVKELGASVKGTRTVCAMKLPEGVTAEDVAKHYLPYGEIKEVYIPNGRETGKLANHAYIEFTDVAAAKKAAKATNGSQLLGHTIAARIKQNQSYLDDGPSRTLYIRRLPFQTTREQVEEFYRSFGNVISVCLMTRPIDGRPHGTAFVTFDNVDAAQKAQNNTDGELFEGRQLVVKFAKKELQEVPEPEKEVDPETIVFVDNISRNCKPADLRQFFSQWGQVERAFISTNEKKDSDWSFGFVRFASREDAQTAIKKTTGTKFMDRLVFPRIKQQPKSTGVVLD